MKRFLESLIPERLRKVKPLLPEQRLKLLSTVADTDNCLRAVEDLLQSHLEQEFFAAIDPRASDAQIVRACQGLRVHYYALQALEEERARAIQLARETKS
jgi:hypothetical protein